MGNSGPDRRVVRGPRRDVEAVAEYLEAADKVKRQVLIEVEILEVILDDHFELGIRHLLTDTDFLGEATLDVEYSCLPPP